jgi:hypothetical protein
MALLFVVQDSHPCRNVDSAYYYIRCRLLGVIIWAERMFHSEIMTNPFLVSQNTLSDVDMSLLNVSVATNSFIYRSNLILGTWT